MARTIIVTRGEDRLPQVAITASRFRGHLAPDHRALSPGTSSAASPPTAEARGRARREAKAQSSSSAMGP